MELMANAPNQFQSVTARNTVEERSAMTPKTFASLATVAALSLLAAIAAYSVRSPWNGETAGTEKLFPGLAARAGDIARIEIEQGGKTVAVEKSDDLWRIASQDGYPASTEKIRALLLALSDATLLEPKTRVPARYTLLEVDDPAKTNSNARLITLKDRDGNTVAEIIAGKQRAGTGLDGQSTGGTYVRRPGVEQSWLASTSLVGGAALKEWTTTRIFETETEKIKELTVEVQGEAPYKIKRNADGSHELEDIPAGKKIKYVNMIDNIIEAASFLDLERVRKPAPAASENAAGTVSFETDGGLKIALKLRRAKDGIWMTIDPSGDGDAKQAAADIASRTRGWEFEVLPSKTDTMLKQKGDLIEDVETSESTAPPPTGAPLQLPTP